MAEFKMPKPPQGFFFRVKMTTLFRVPVIKVELRRKSFLGSYAVDYLYSYVSGSDHPEESTQEAAMRLARSLTRRHGERETAFERLRLADDMKGDYDG